MTAGWTRPGSSDRDERGQVGGIEAVVFGMLILVVGILVVANAWGVIDAKMTAGAGAREAARTFVTAPAGTDPLAAAERAGSDTLASLGRSGPGDRVDPVLPLSFTRCATVTFKATVRVPLISLPWLGHAGEGFTVVAEHTEVVDPYRNGLTGTGAQGSAACA